MQIMQEMRMDYSVIAGKDNSYFLFFIHGSNKAIFVSNGEGSAFVLNTENNIMHWKTLASLDKNELKALQPSAFQPQEIVTVVGSQPNPRDWKDQMRTALLKSNPTLRESPQKLLDGFEYKSIDDDEANGYQREEELRRGLNIAIDKLRRRMDQVAVDEGLGEAAKENNVEPRLLMAELKLDKQGHLRHYFSPEIVQKIKAKIPEAELESLGDDWWIADTVIVDQGGPGWGPAGSATGVPVFPTWYIGIIAALGAGVLAYLYRRRVLGRKTTEI